jgi:hypothetical protein
MMMMMMMMMMPCQQLQGQLQKEHSVDTINYNRKASLENSALEKLLFLPYTTENIRTVGTRTVPINSKIILIKQ